MYTSYDQIPIFDEFFPQKYIEFFIELTNRLMAVSIYLVNH